MALGGFERADAKVSVHEGGYSNHKADPGGATNKGIIQSVYDSYRKSKGETPRSVKQLEEAERLDIYRNRYWKVIKGDKLPEGVDYVVYDGAVNSGPSQSVKWLQRALGAHYTGKIDGLIGDETFRAIEAYGDNHDALVRNITDRRMDFLKALSTFKTFGNGWTVRVKDVRAVGQAWAKGDTAPAVKFVENGNAKAYIQDAKKAPGKGLADSATGGGVLSGGASLTLSQLQEQLTPYSAAGGWIEKLVVALIILGAVLTLSGLVYRVYANRKKAAMADALDLQPVSP